MFFHSKTFSMKEAGRWFECHQLLISLQMSTMEFGTSTVNPGTTPEHTAVQFLSRVVPASSAGGTCPSSVSGMHCDLFVGARGGSKSKSTFWQEDFVRWTPIKRPVMPAGTSFCDVNSPHWWSLPRSMNLQGKQNGHIWTCHFLFINTVKFYT